MGKNSHTLKIKKVALLLSIILLFGMAALPVLAAEEQADYTAYYVAPDGEDTNPGTFSAPFATLQAAQEAARETEGRVVVNLREGTYRFTKSLALTKEDNNTTYRAYMDEKVVFTGADELPAGQFARVTDEAVLSRIVDKKARDFIYAIDLKATGITDYGTLAPYGNGEKEIVYDPALFVDDERLTLSRYPNEGYLTTGNVAETGTALTKADEVREIKYSKFEVADSRLQKWDKAEDIWAFGYFMHDWAESNIPVQIEGNTVTAKHLTYAGVVSNRRLYFYNLLEELDQAGEYYLDRANGTLYLYAETSPAASSIHFATFARPFITMDGCEDVAIKGIAFEKSVSKGIVGTDLQNVTVADCEFSGISDGVVSILQSSGCTVVGNHVHDVGSFGIQLGGGDRVTLTPGNNVIENNLVEHFSQVKTTYSPGVEIVGVGNAIRNNEICHAPHFAIVYGSNDNVIEYNDIHNVCTDTADSGAVYICRDWTARGNELRYNYFHDLQMIDTNTGMQMQAVYLDDQHSSTNVHGNIFYKVDSVALIGGGRNNTFQYNIMLECAKPLVLDERGTNWQADAVKAGGSFRNILDSLPYQEGTWAEKYPELVNILEDEPGVPKYNVVSENVEYKSAGYQIAEAAKPSGRFENNIELSNTQAFADYKNKDFTLLADSEIFEKIPDFEPINFGRIGLRDNEVKEIEQQSVILSVGSPRAVANGERMLVDKENLSVMPQILEDRTLVPVRFVAESLGAKVDWEEQTQTVRATLSGRTVTLVLGSDSMTVDGKSVPLDVPAQTLHDRTMIPLRAVAEAFGKQVFWDDKGLIVINDQETQDYDSFTVDVLLRAVSVD